MQFLSNFVLALKNTVCPENFHCIEYTFYIQEFWATCVCPEKQSCPETFDCIKIFFIIQDFWATCACPENRVCTEISKPGVAASPRLVRLCRYVYFPFSHLCTLFSVHVFTKTHSEQMNQNTRYIKMQSNFYGNL